MLELQYNRQYDKYYIILYIDTLFNQISKLSAMSDHHNVELQTVCI